MIALPLETWVSVGALVGVALALWAAMRNEMSGLRGEMGGLRGEMGGLRGEMGGLRGEMRGLRGEMVGLRDELRGEIRDLRTELKADLHQQSLRTSELERRVYELALGLRPYLDESRETKAQ